MATCTGVGYAASMNIARRTPILLGIIALIVAGFGYFRSPLRPDAEQIAILSAALGTLIGALAFWLSARREGGWRGALAAYGGMFAATITALCGLRVVLLLVL